MTRDQVHRSYGVKLVRGPFVRLEPHGDSCTDEPQVKALAARLRAESPQVRLAADLFSGAGGLSLGMDRAGFNTVVAVDHYAEAVETHRHHFQGLSVDWDLSDPTNVERLASLLVSLDVCLIAGGPPCQPFSKAGRSGIRHRVRNGLRDPHDQRRDLWRAFIEVIRLVRPAAVLMENVPDMVLDREMFILRAMVQELEMLGYAVEEKVVEAWRYGVPQFRQRLILVALREHVAFDWPPERPEKVSVWNAIGDLPEVDGGFRHAEGADGWTTYGGARTSFQRKMRAGTPTLEQHRLYDHITRPVRADDREAFSLMTSTTRYSDLPDKFKRYRQDIFDDKYKRLDEDDLSRTITAHIAKDGYWYIHPRQSRTITVREAARLQTFPDYYRFAGTPSAAFKQIGNAVPPLMAEAIAGAIGTALSTNRPSGPTSGELALTLAEWYRNIEPRGIPWLRARTRWQVVSAETLLERAAADVVSLVWPLLKRWDLPDQTLDHADELRQIGSWIAREGRVDQLLNLAKLLAPHGDPLKGPTRGAGETCNVTQATLDLAALAVSDDDDDEPVLAGRGVLRVAARFAGTSVDRRNRLTDGRLAIARLISYSDVSRDAHKGLLELAATVCTPQRPRCDVCPLNTMCSSSQLLQIRASRLF